MARLANIKSPKGLLYYRGISLFVKSLVPFGEKIGYCNSSVKNCPNSLFYILVLECL